MYFTSLLELCNTETKEELRLCLERYRRRLNDLRREYVNRKRNPATLEGELSFIRLSMRRVKRCIAECERIVL